VSLGTHALTAGGDQFVRVDDDLDYTPSGDRRIPGDALRLTRAGSWCGDGACDPDEDPATCPADCDAADTGGPSDDSGGGGGTGWSDPAGSVPTTDGPPPVETGCATVHARGLGGAVLVALLGLRVRRRER